MFNTKKHISRRTVLKGAGVNLALPFLSAMVPASTALAQTAANPKLRAGFFYIPHGAIMFNTKFGAAQDRWTPKGSGADFTLNEINSPLEPFKKYTTSFGNLENAAAAGLRARPQPGDVAERDVAGRQQHVHDARPGDGEVHQQGHAVSVAGACLRDHGPGGCRQRRPVYDAFLPRRTHAAAHGVQPPQGLFATFRRGGNASRTRGDGARDQQHAGRDPGPHKETGRRSGQRRPRDSGFLSDRCARSRAPRQNGRQLQPFGDQNSQRADRRAGKFRRTGEAHVRSS